MRGEVVYMFAFDVAYEIKTSRVHEILSERPVRLSLRLDRTTPRDVPFHQPLTIALPAVANGWNGHEVQVQVRVYDIGALSINLHVPFEVERLQELMPYHNPVTADGRTFVEIAAGLCQQVLTSLSGALVRPTPLDEPEAYTVFCINDLGGPSDAEAWLTGRRAEVSGLLTETAPERLSDGQIAETMRILHSFERGDAVVIDWDAAMVVDLNGYVDDVLYALEVATIQLEELKTIDAQLDRHMDQAYEDFAGLKRRLGRGKRILNELRRIQIDTVRLTEEVTHISKFFGDWYLARVFIGARNRFHLDHWRASVEQRLANLDHLYSVVQGEANDRRMLLLETMIVLLFVIDIAALFFFDK